MRTFQVAPKFLGIALLFLAWPAEAQSTDLTFSGFYPKSFDWWALAVVAAFAIAAGALVFFSGGTASPIVATAGTWIGGISGLHGAAATSFGLALLGGGSLASGGLGMAGGVAVLTAAVKFAPSAATIALTYAYDEYDKRQFVERSINMLALPLPRVDVGPPLHRSAIRAIQDGYKGDFDNSDAEKIEAALARNRQKVGAALQLSNSADLASLSREDAAKVHVGRALMQLHNGDHGGAKRSVEQAIGQSGSNFFKKESRTVRVSLPATLWAISALSDEDVKVEDTLAALDYAIAVEPDKRVVPIILACYLDRLMLRDDLLRPEHIRRIYESVRQHIGDMKVRAAATLILTYRSFVVLRLNQDFVTTIASRSDRKKSREKIGARVERGSQAYNFLLNVIDEMLVAIRANDSYFMASLENRIHIGDLSRQLQEYRKFEPALSEMARKFAGSRSVTR